MSEHPKGQAGGTGLWVPIAHWWVLGWWGQRPQDQPHSGTAPAPLPASIPSPSPFCHPPSPPAPLPAALSSPRFCHFYLTPAVKIGVK